MITRRLTGAGLGSLIAGMVVAGLVGEAFAGPGLKPAARLAFNASARLSFSDSRPPADVSALAEAKRVAGLRQAADAGSSEAQLDLGLCYERGQGVVRDAAQAITWFRKAAEQGCGEAQYALGCCYNGENGSPRVPGEATKWWGKAAAQGHADAQFCLGLSYAMGEGVAKDPTEAAKWWTKAAEQNHANAQYFLGLSWSLGLGIPQDPAQAIHWLSKAAANGNENAAVALRKLGVGGDLPNGKQSAVPIRPGRADELVHSKPAPPAARQGN